MGKKEDLVFETIWAEAQRRGNEAANKCMPAPMVVQQHANPLNDRSEVVQQWVVPDGPCGFAWVVIRPANCPFANWLKKKNYASKSYNGGVSIWISEHRQSVIKKSAHAIAMANYFNSVGIKASSHERDD